MRLLSFAALVALVSSCAVTSAATHLDAGHQPVKRSLRQYDFNELSGTELDGEERNVGTKVNDVIKKADDLLGKVQSVPKSLTAVVKKAVIMSADDLAAVAKKIKAKYPKDLSASTLAQVNKVEEQRLKDLAKYSKESTDGMRRKIEPFPGMKIAPKEYLGSHIGRDMQRYGDDGSRLLSCNVISRPKEQGGGDVLLVSSSNPTKNDWLLPKGGWDKGEDVQKAAWREAIEEGGVNGKLTAGLGKLNFKNKDGKKYRYYAYKMQAKTVYDDWSESVRYRLWVSYEDALKMLGNRKEMVDIVKRAKLADDLAAANKLPKEDPKLAALDYLKPVTATN
ncbi:Nudix hydrolase 3 [Phytophthora pseudosyringae]|uniref:Nudix hydrolase 3 n=1 Tax=Phytophthora pseudosyringae TaxID=221518 RepID=A0A8T1VWY6_9STRA|nr:Nudix hydrolase 3 [Phytophthora pseudosyringae]